MTKDDDQPAASGREQPKRVLAHPARKTAPAGTPYNRFPPPQPEPLAVPAPAPPPERPLSTAQNTTTSPRTVGGHTARLLRGEPMEEEEDEEDEAPSEPAPSLRAHAAARSAQPRPVAPAANVAPSSSRGGTIRMDAVESPPIAAPPVARKVPAAPPPLSPEPMENEPPSTARGGSARDFPIAGSAFAGRPIPAPAAAHTPSAASPLSPVVTSAPTGEITITASELEASVLPPEASESRWPFAFAVGAVSLAIGSLLPLPFRRYIVPEHAVAAGASSAPGPSAAPAIATADLLRTPTAPPRVTGAATPPPTFVPPVGGVPTAASTVRPAPFGSVKVPRTNPTTPKDIF